MINSLTIVIPTFNEEKHIAACIAGISNDFAKKIFVVDSNSSDNTAKIAKSMGAEVIYFEWNGKFPKKRNWFLKNHKIDSKWVLFLDADEIITKNFKVEVERVLSYTTHKGFYLSYTNYFLGKKLKGGFKMMKLALFQVNAGLYEKIEEDYWSNLDMEVHEHPIINGSIGYIKSAIDHKDFNGIYRYINKHNEYSSWEALRYINLSQKDKKSLQWNWRQKIKYKLIKNPISSIFYFIGQYLLMGGFKDGLPGLFFAIFKASYYTQVSSKIYEIKNNTII